MIIIYDKNEKLFNNRGLGNLSDVNECSVKVTLNGEYILEMTYPIDGEHYNDIQIDNIILAPVMSDTKYTLSNRMQPFRIVSINRDTSEYITVNANHISYDMNGVIVKEQPTNLTEPTGFDKSLAKIKRVYGDNIFNITIADGYTSSNFKNINENIDIPSPTTIRNVLNGNKSFISTYSVEILYDMRDVKLFPVGGLGENLGVRLNYGQNITDLEIDSNQESKATCVLPIYSKSETTNSMAPTYKYYEAHLTNESKVEPLGPEYLTVTELVKKKEVPINNNQKKYYTFKIPDSQRNWANMITIWNNDIWLSVSSMNNWKYGMHHDEIDLQNTEVKSNMSVIDEIFDIYKNAYFKPNNTRPILGDDTEAIWITYSGTPDDPNREVIFYKFNEDQDRFDEYELYKNVGVYVITQGDTNNHLIHGPNIIEGRLEEKWQEGKYLVPYIVLNDGAHTESYKSPDHKVRIFPCRQIYSSTNMPNFISLGYSEYSDYNTTTNTWAEINPIMAYANPKDLNWIETRPNPDNEIYAPGCYNAQSNSIVCNLFYVLTAKDSIFDKKIIRWRDADTIIELEPGLIEPSPEHNKACIYKYVIRDEEGNITSEKYFMYYSSKWNEVSESLIVKEPKYLGILDKSAVKKLDKAYPDLKAKQISKTDNINLENVYWVEKSYTIESKLCSLVNSNKQPMSAYYYSEESITEASANPKIRNNVVYIKKYKPTDSDVYSYTFNHLVLETVPPNPDNPELDPDSPSLTSCKWQQLTNCRNTQAVDANGKPTISGKYDTYYYVFKMDPETGDVVADHELWKVWMYWQNPNTGTKEWVEVIRKSEDETVDDPIPPYYYLVDTLSLPYDANTYFYTDEKVLKDYDWNDIESSDPKYKYLSWLMNHHEHYRGCVFIGLENLSDEVTQHLSIVDLTDKFETEFTEFSSKNIKDRQNQLFEYVDKYYFNKDEYNINKVKIDTSLTYIKATADSPEYAKFLETEQIHLGDVVTVIYHKFDIRRELRITAYEYNVKNDRFDSITLGEIKEELADILITTGDDVSLLNNDSGYTTNNETSNKINSTMINVNNIMADHIEAAIGIFDEISAEKATIDYLQAKIINVEEIVTDPVVIKPVSATSIYQGAIVTDITSIPKEQNIEKKIMIGCTKAMNYTWDEDNQILSIDFTI